MHRTVSSLTSKGMTIRELSSQGVNETIGWQDTTGRDKTYGLIAVARWKSAHSTEAVRTASIHQIAKTPGYANIWNV